MESPLISVIIPVYNSGKKLNHCLRSLLSQTYQCFEIILVDDKSTDLKTLQIEDDWLKEDKRIRIFRNTVNGEHEPRLWGVRQSHGTYICFSDQDDWLPKNSLEVMLTEAVEKDLDVAIGQISKVVKIGPFSKEFPQKQNMDLIGKVIEQKDLMEHYYHSYFGWNILPVTVWGKLYRRSLFQRADQDLEYAFRFKNDASDLLMSMALHPHIKRLCVIDDVVYSYFIGTPGVSPKYLKTWLPMSCDLFRYKWEMLDRYNFRSAERLLAFEMINYIKSFVSICTIYEQENRDAHINVLANVLQDPIWEKVGVLKIHNVKDLGIVNMILQKDSNGIFEKEERKILDAPFVKRLKYSIMRSTVKWKS